MGGGDWLNSRMESSSSSSRPKTGVGTSGCWLILEGRQERLRSLFRGKDCTSSDLSLI